VVVLGGEGNGQAYDTVELLDPSTNLWTQIASLNYARHGTQAIVSGDGIFVAGGSPNQGGGNQHNLEAFNSIMPTGQANSAGSLIFADDELVISSSEAHSITLLHNAGNQGVIITSIELTGEGAESFELTEQGILPALITAGGSKTISIKGISQIEDEVALLEVTYSDEETVIVPIRYSTVEDDFLLYVVPAIISAVQKNN